MNKFCPSCGCWSLVPYCGVWGDLDQVFICDTCDQTWTQLGLEAALTTMKLDNKKEIVIQKYRFAQPVPNYVSFGHRHLEKECPGSVVAGTEQRYLIPVDLLSIVLPKDVAEEVESVELVYGRKTI